ncbi:UDP-3-O-[3-hydroxymyristoyl] N-acetylglucosamine deacetylase [Candidatus Woesearchaeota archaeon]|nr:UDP-3-O-[3-hydroxymyristoyl] N-acetylglucosamine deacetylase [Candidatus Woesearchaeota archaeon]
MAEPVEIEGRGLHSGVATKLRFLPAAAGSGIRFIRVDLPGRPALPARVDLALGGEPDPRRTTLSMGPAVIGTVEHVLAAAAGLGIDNLDIEIDSEEPCEPDGSARPFVDLFLRAGVKELPDLRHYFEVRQPISFEEGGAQRVILPHDGMKVSFTIDYRSPLIGTQYASFELDSDFFVNDLASARTFAMLEDVEGLRESGLIKGGSLANAVVVTPDEIRSDEPLRFGNEFVRHKILDLIGDLSLLGMPLKGHVIAVRGGHAANVQLVKRIRDEAVKSYRWRSPGQESISLDINAILEIMPHRYPMLLVDRIVELVDGKRVVGIKNVTINEPFFQGHFPGHPIMPAVLVVEAMAQAGGVLLLNTVERPETKLMYFLGIDNAKFRKPVLPGDTLRFELELVNLKRKFCKMRGKAFIGDDLAAEADLLSTIVDKPGAE